VKKERREKNLRKNNVKPLREIKQIILIVRRNSIHGSLV